MSNHAWYALIDGNAPCLELLSEPYPQDALQLFLTMVAGHPCLLFVNSAYQAGAYTPAMVKKHIIGLRMARANHLTCVHWVQSSGADLSQHAEVFAGEEGMGGIFYHQSQLRAAGIFQMAFVVGHCIAGGAYIPALSDYVVMLSSASLALAGTWLTHAATGEWSDGKTLGGPAVHVASGLVHDVVDTLSAGCQLLRQQLMQLPHVPFQPERLPGVCSSMLHNTYTPEGLLTAVTDDQTLKFFKPSYGMPLVCATGYVTGYRTSWLCTNGPLTTASALKAIDFFTSQQHPTVMVHVHHVTGFMVGATYEAQGMLKHAAQWIRIMSTCPWPHITLWVGHSMGAGHYALCGTAFQPHFSWAWPQAVMGIMGSDALQSVTQRLKKEVKQPIAEQQTATYAAHKGYVHGLIQPEKTRSVLSFCIAIAHQSLHKNPTHPKQDSF
jgi:3-methylcrotonyl-CoA carboxylase beta subunit